jgi:hypothetical protein
VAEYVHYAGMATITKRLEKRYVAEGDELAHDALVAIRELREALIGMVLDSTENLRLARAALAKHR